MDVLAQRGELGAFQRLQRVAHRPEKLEALELALGTSLAALRDEVREAIARCPQCGARMADLGLDFEPPRTSDVRAWNRIRTMHELGHAWYTCGCDGPGFVPTTASDYDEYLAKREKLFTARLQAARRSRTLDPRARAEEAEHWASLLARIGRDRQRRRRRARIT